MKRPLYLTIVMIMALALLLVSCVRPAPDPGDGNGDTPETPVVDQPTPLPTLIIPAYPADGETTPTDEAAPSD